MKEYLDDRSPIPEDIISPRILTKRGLLVFGGLPKIGKSYFLISWLVYMAAGRSFLGMTPNRPLKIFYMLTEIEYEYMKERLQQLDNELLNVAANNLIITPKMHLSFNHDEISEIKEIVNERFKTNVLAIDPLCNIFSSE
ncbi:AAA domain protein [Wolbachia endosymbiont of Trichogramma pretiosum]|nr:AAA family ATPase [Wolbachia endosymbiont of Trichogramma pretiosum]OCA07045.1 AAA domain protein [Wolbachia endosymbiont of Trichogramma pretiosum]